MDALERAAAGRAARSEARRSSHATWEPPGDLAVTPVSGLRKGVAKAQTKDSTRALEKLTHVVDKRDHAALVAAIGSGRIEAEEL